MVRPGLRPASMELLWYDLLILRMLWISASYPAGPEYGHLHRRQCPNPELGKPFATSRDNQEEVLPLAWLRQHGKVRTWGTKFQVQSKGGPKNWDVPVGIAYDSMIRVIIWFFCMGWGPALRKSPRLVTLVNATGPRPAAERCQSCRSSDRHQSECPSHGSQPRTHSPEH